MTTLSELENQSEFTGRHIGPGATDNQSMLETLGFDSMDTFIDQVVPASIRSSDPMGISAPLSEALTLARLKDIASKNVIKKSLIGMGYYNTHTPSVILRNVLENPAWYTAYTPYQPEISQGRLEAMLNFQTMIQDLTSMDIANASLLDEGTAAAEAMALCKRSSRNKQNILFVSEGCLPQTIAVVQTRAEHMGLEIKIGNHLTDLVPSECFAALLQYPAVNGEVFDYSDTIAALQKEKAFAIVAADLLGLTYLKPPGEMNADVVVGNSQRFGVPLGYGGPHAAFMAVTDKLKRAMPGRLIGVSVDAQGNQCYRMALQTREQHIRREKATSNVCTAQALLAVMAGFYAIYHGPEGLQRIAGRVHRMASILVAALKEKGITPVNENWFDTLTLNTAERTADIHAAAREQGINLREISDSQLGLSLDETVTRDELQTLLQIITGDHAATLDVDTLDKAFTESLSETLQRSGNFLTHPVFHSYRSETEMMRYMRKLADKDLALDRSMIPLGSCTMKLNAATEMLPVSWPEFSSLHPFAPLDQAEGYRIMIQELEQMLCACTGYDAVSLQPNAGSQGEYAGLLAIQAYHESRGEGHRNICLIPSSAHGTNPASAHMAGLKVVVVACDEHGNVDAADLKKKAEEHSANLSSIMITYPSTHGVFEAGVREVCGIVHDHGGQVYIDGANLNAQVGLCAPGHYGGDVSHLNLHKTFCIPHGGGGPGVGPIGVRQHLAEFLPGYAVINAENAPSKVGPVSSAPWGSASILPITWCYITMMGEAGLTEASKSAILNANYISRCLSEHYPVLYSGPGGLVAHECIIDLRPLKEKTGVTVDDVAKRLIDYGFHAPTMSFPVAGTLMIEPTESESKAELDRFCDAMIQIRTEIREVEEEKIEVEGSPLHNAPHTVAMISADKWEFGYSRQQAAFPVASLRDGKYWSPVARVDNAYGDRNLICSCPPLSAYED